MNKVIVRKKFPPTYIMSYFRNSELCLVASENMDEYKLIECVIDLMNSNNVRKYSDKERRIAKVIKFEIRREEVLRSDIYEKLAKHSASGIIDNIVEELFRDDINLGRIISAYGYFVYAVDYNVGGKTKVLDKFNDFYERRLKPWLDSNDVWNKMYKNTYHGSCQIL